MHVVLLAYSKAAEKHQKLQSRIGNEKLETCDGYKLSIRVVSNQHVDLDLTEEELTLILVYHLCEGEIREISVTISGNTRKYQYASLPDDATLQADLSGGWYRLSSSPCIFVARARAGGVSKVVQLFETRCVDELAKLKDRLEKSCAEKMCDACLSSLLQSR